MLGNTAEGLSNKHKRRRDSNKDVSTPEALAAKGARTHFLSSSEGKILLSDISTEPLSEYDSGDISEPPSRHLKKYEASGSSLLMHWDSQGGGGEGGGEGGGGSAMVVQIPLSMVQFEVQQKAKPQVCAGHMLVMC